MREEMHEQMERDRKRTARPDQAAAISESLASLEDLAADLDYDGLSEGAERLRTEIKRLREVTGTA